MNRLSCTSKVIGAKVFATILLLSASAVHAENSVVGRWICKSESLRVDMEFTPDGHCTATAVAGEQKSELKGTYKVGPSEVVITPGDAPPLTYGLKFEGETITLTGGDFGEGKALTFSKREAMTKAAEENKAKSDDAVIPGGVWDVKSLEVPCEILKTTYDPTTNKVTFLLEMREGERRFLNYNVAFLDEDDVKLGGGPLQFTPNGTNKGQHSRGIVTLLNDEKMKKCRKVIVTKLR